MNSVALLLLLGVARNSEAGFDLRASVKDKKKSLSSISLSELLLSREKLNAISKRKAEKYLLQSCSLSQFALPFS